MSEHICICDTCDIPVDCWPRSGVYAMNANQDFTKLCARYRRHIESNWERLFGTPENTARFIIEHCGGDCYACLLPDDAPCFRNFSVEDGDEKNLLEWLGSKAEG